MTGMHAGFRKSHSTTGQIFSHKCCITDLLLFSSKKLYAAFEDFREAFDTVCRIALWQKVLKTGIQGNFFALFSE